MYTDDMLAKKQSADWYIAATHYLTAGFVVPLLGGIIIGYSLAATRITDLAILSAVSVVGSALLIYLGVIYSSRYVNKTYVITSPQKIINLSTAYLFIAESLYLLYLYWGETDILPEFLIVDVLGFVVTVAVFYVASRRYISQ